MALKKVVKPETEDKFLSLMKKCTDIDMQICKLQDEKVEIQKEMLEIKIEPFKVGDYAYADIPSGRSKKRQKCLLECESGVLYLRPVNKDGELSGRHFSCTPLPGKSYSDLLQKVEE